jgi:hypothetical protein
MSAVKFNLRVARTPVANPETLFQFLAASNHRALLLGIEIMPQGVTAGVAPVIFDIVTQSDAGTASSGTFVKDLPAAAETIQASAQVTFTAEPTLGSILHEFSLHQQGSRLWLPPTGPMIIPGSQRIGLRYKSGSFVAIDVMAYFEE